LHKDDSLFDVLARIAAVKISGCPAVISVPLDLDNRIAGFLQKKEGERFLGDAPVIHETDEDLVEKIPGIHRIRYAAPDRVPHRVFVEAAKTGFYISRTRVMMEGRIELLQYFREQSVCNNYHRYGNLGERAMN